MPSRLAVIPARGGSKRIPGKNIRNFCGKPMIGHILQAASASRLFDTIHVSTEDRHIADVAAGLGYPVDFMRSEELADDHTPLMPVLRYVAETYAVRGKKFDEIWLLMACAPLIGPEDLVGASEFFRASGGSRSVMAVTQYPVPVEWAFRRRDNGQLDALNPEAMAMRSQDLAPAFHDAGAMYVFSTRTVLENEGAGDYSAYAGYLLPRHKAIDIDSEEDLRLAELIFLSGKKMVSA